MALKNVNTPNASSDLVGIYDEDFNQLFPEARPLKMSYSETSRMMEHPIESGSIVVDHKVFMPATVEAVFIIQSEDYRSVYDQIESAYSNNTIVTIQGKAKSFNNMVLSSKLHDESSEIYDTIQVVVKFTELFIAQITKTLTVSSVASPNDSDTINDGNLQGAESSLNPSQLYEWIAQ